MSCAVTSHREGLCIATCFDMFHVVDYRCGAKLLHNPFIPLWRPFPALQCRKKEKTAYPWRHLERRNKMRSFALWMKLPLRVRLGLKILNIF